MSRLIFVLLGMGVLLGTALGGWLHAQFDVYGDSELLQQAARHLRRSLPEKCGKWRSIRDEELEADLLMRLHCEAFVNRVYEHEQTGDQVAVTVLVGPAGSLAAHVPENCYSPATITLQKERTRFEFTDGKGRKHAFWEVGFRSKLVSTDQMRILYGWSEGDGWKAPSSPRIELGNRPYLYKVQVAGAVSSPRSDWSPCENFSAQFVTQLQDHLIDPLRN
jgi:hypothetical protein